MGTIAEGCTWKLCSNTAKTFATNSGNEAEKGEINFPSQEIKDIINRSLNYNSYILKL